VIRLGRRRGGKLRSFFSTRDCSQHIPSRGAAHGYREQLCLVVADADLSGANSSRRGHSIQELVLAGLRLTQAIASTVVVELAQTGGISIHRGGSDRTTWPNLGLWCLLLVRFVFMIELGFVVLSSSIGFVVPIPEGFRSCRRWARTLGTSRT